MDEVASQAWVDEPEDWPGNEALVGVGQAVARCEEATARFLGERCFNAAIPLRSA